MRMERRNAIRGTDIRTFPFFVKLHVELSRASSIFFSVSFALSRLLAKVSKTSWRLLGSGCEKLGASILSGTAAAVTLPGTDAMCRANWPGEKDFGWGFQASLSSGIRSKTRFVVCASWSISIKMESTSLITAPFYCFFEQNLFTTKAVNPPAEITLPAVSAALHSCCRRGCSNGIRSSQKDLRAVVFAAITRGVLGDCGPVRLIRVGKIAIAVAIMMANPRHRKSQCVFVAAFRH